MTIKRMVFIRVVFWPSPTSRLLHLNLEWLAVLKGTIEIRMPIIIKGTIT